MVYLKDVLYLVYYSPKNTQRNGVISWLDYKERLQSKENDQGKIFYKHCKSKSKSASI